jgi:hypothetical protein
MMLRGGQVCYDHGRHAEGAMVRGFADTFFRKSKLILVEPLGSTIRLGSVGFMDAGQWNEVGTTKSMFGLTLTVGRGRDSNSFDAKSGKGLRFETKIAGQISQLVPKATQAEARAEINFGSAGAFVLNVIHQRVDTALERAEIMAAIRFAYRYRHTLPEGSRWEKTYAVIVGVASAESVTILSSDSASAAVVITGSKKLAAPASPAELHAHMKISHSSNSVDKLWLARPAGYAFQAIRIRPSVFRAWDREDFAFVSPREAFGFDEPAPLRGPKRPRSYVEWSRQAKLKPSWVQAEPVRRSGPTGAHRGGK